MNDSKNIKRARSAQEKEDRKESILIAAQTLFESNSCVLPSVIDIANEAAVSKGSVYNYFSTKEEIYLTLLHRGYETWLAVIYAELTKVKPTINGFLSEYVSFCESQPVFMKLVALAPVILEENISVDSAYEFKRALAQEVKSIATLIVHAFPSISIVGKAEQLFLSSYSLTVGLWQLCHPSKVIKEVTDKYELSVLRPDFKSTLLDSLLDLWLGAIKNLEK